MVKCPKCQKEVDYLENIIRKHDYDLVAGEKGQPLFRPITTTWTEDEFRCPKCKALITTKLKEATQFLNKTP